MKKLLSLIFFVAIGATSSFAQLHSNSPTSGPIYNINSADAMRVVDMPMKPPGRIGDEMLFDGWKNGVIILNTGDTLADVMSNYNLQSDWIEIDYKDEIKILRSSMFKAWEVENTGGKAFTQYVPGRKLVTREIPLTGIFEVIIPGSPFQLLEKKWLEVYEANYKGQMSGGSTNDRYVVKEVLYLANGNDLVEVKSRGRLVKELNRITGRNYKAFLKENKINIKDENKLGLLLKELNQ